MSDAIEFFENFMRDSAKYSNPKKNRKTVGQILKEQEFRNEPMPATTDYGVDLFEIEEAISKYKKSKIAELEQEAKNDLGALLLYYSEMPLEQVLSSLKLTKRQLGLMRKKYCLSGVRKRVGIQYYANA